MLPRQYKMNHNLNLTRAIGMMAPHTTWSGLEQIERAMLAVARKCFILFAKTHSIW